MNDKKEVGSKEYDREYPKFKRSYFLKVFASFLKPSRRTAGHVHLKEAMVKSPTSLL